MADEDFETRKLAYLNLSARSDTDLKTLDAKFPDVVRALRGEAPAKSPAFPPSDKASPLTLPALIAAFGALDVAKEAMSQLTAGEYELFAEAGREVAKALGHSQPQPQTNNLSAIDNVLNYLPLLTGDELNAVLDALSPLIDAGGASPQAQTTELAPGFPIAWRDMQWKAKVKLANALGGQVATATEADTFLTAKEAELKGA